MILLTEPESRCNYKVLEACPRGPPSIVVSFAKALDSERRQIGIRATFKKDRTAVVDPCRTLTFTLDREAGKLVLAGDVEVVGNCREAVIDVLWRAYQRGVKSISRKGLLDEVWERHRKPTKTVDNTLGAMVGDRLPRRRDVSPVELGQ